MRRIICVLLLAALLAALPAHAAGPDVPNWYEVFVRAYQDSDGDGLGDLAGLTARLDYIQEMGWRGLWLMPLMPSPSYHKYDVTDYRAVDPEYGTLDDMRALVRECRARGIRLIVDLPVNHTSDRHPWFVAAAEALRAGDTGNACVDYYHFSDTPADGYVPLGDTGWYYEARVSADMPDLNLDSPAVLDELEAVFRFWLDDMGVDGFRLGGVTDFYTGDAERNIECLRGLKAMAEEIKPGSVLIGECRADLKTIADCYASGVDSFFLFPAAQAEGFIAGSILARKNQAENFARGYQAALDAIPEGWLAPFLCNHDTGRTVGLVQGRSKPELAKLAEGVLGMLNGAVFQYYGEEIGMVGSGDDPNKRLAMYWSDGDMAQQPPGANKGEYPYPCVEKQQKDGKSLLNYVKAVNAARLAIPAISLGQNTFDAADGSVCVMRRTHESGDCQIAINFSSRDSYSMAVEPWEIAFDLETGTGSAKLTEKDGETTLKLPPCAIVVLTPPRPEE